MDVMLGENGPFSKSINKDDTDKLLKEIFPKVNDTSEKNDN